MRLSLLDQGGTKP